MGSKKASNADVEEAASLVDEDSLSIASSTRRGRGERGMKSLFPWTTSYTLRRKLAFAVVGAMFIVAGLVVSFAGPSSGK